MSSLGPNAETYRLLAVAQLVKGNWVEARKNIERALEQAPQALPIRILAAMIDYFSAIVPKTNRNNILDFPPPIPWDLIKQDEDSLTRLRRAADAFRALLDEKIGTDEERGLFEIWLLACLANDQGKQGEAETYCQQALAKDPSRPLFIAWALERRYHIDVNESSRVLEQRIEEGDYEIPEICAMIAISLVQGDAQKAEEILEKHHAFFSKEDQETIWTYWKVQVKAVTGDLDGAIAFLYEFAHKDQLGDLYARLLMQDARRSKDSVRALAFMQQEYERTNDPQFLLMLCELKAESKDWEFIAGQVEALLKAIPGPEALRLVAFALYNTKRFSECQEVLNRYKSLFREARLPQELRKVQSHSLAFLGNIPEALTRAEDVALEDNSPTSWVELAILQATYGDYAGVQRSARKVLSNSMSEIQHLLKCVEIVRIEDTSLAKALWMRAAKRGFPDKWLPWAVQMAFELGLDQEAGPLLLRLQNMGDGLPGGMERKNLQEMIEIIRERKRFQENLETNYWHAQAPIHLAAQLFPLGLGFLLHSVPSLNKKEPHWQRKFPLYIRHGSRWIHEGSDLINSDRTLIMDLSAILLAHHFGLWKATEEAFPTIYIPATTTAALSHLKVQSLPHQPSRIGARNAVLELVDRGNITEAKEETITEEWLDLVPIWDIHLRTLLSLAREKKGKVITFLPIMKVDLSGPVEGLPQSVLDLLIDDLAVVNTLRSQGPFSDVDYHKALTKLGKDQAQQEEGTSFERGCPLFLMHGMAEHLASADILGALCTSYPVIVLEQEIKALRDDQKGDEFRRELPQFLDAIKESLSWGIREKRYILLPPTEEEANQGSNKHDQDPIYHCLINALHPPSDMQAMVWCDDRVVSGFSGPISFPIVGILDILKLLRTKTLLSEMEYFEKLIELRESNCRFIPLEAEEMLFHLSQAISNDKRITETRALRVLRQYAAACFLDKESLVPPAGQDRPGEARFIIQHMHAVADAIILTWKDPQIPKEQKEARANWLVENLYMDIPSLKTCLGWPHTAEEETVSTAVGLAGLIGRAVDFPRDSPACTSALRRNYLSWLYRRLIIMKAENDPSLMESVMISLRGTLSGILEDTDDPEMRAAARSILQAFHEDLPSPMREKIIDDDHFAHAMGIKRQRVITAGGVRYAIEEFFRAAHDALNGAVAPIKGLDGPQSYEMRRLPDEQGPGSLELKNIESGLTTFVYGSGLEALIDSTQGRLNVIKKNRAWYDCAFKDIPKINQEIAARENYQDRVGVLQRWTETSATLYYQRLEDKLREDPALHFYDMKPPSALGLMRHLRLSKDGEHTVPFASYLEESASLLMKEDGLYTAFSQLKDLPVELPGLFLSECESMTLSEKRSFIKKVLSGAASPVALLHLLRLLTLFSKDWPAARRLASRFIRFILSKDYLDSLKSLGALLDWAVDNSHTWPDIKGLPTRLRLAIIWMHAGRLHGILARMGVPSDWIEKLFRQNVRLPVELVWPDGYRPEDAAYPKSNLAIPLVCSGLAYALKSDEAELQSSVICALLEPIVLIKTEQLTMPVASLLKDPTLCSNDLGSFMGLDHGKVLAEQLREELPLVFSSSFIESVATTSITALEDDPSLEWVWRIILSIAANRRIYKSLEERFLVILSRLDLIELFCRNKTSAFLAIKMIAYQSPHLTGDVLRARYVDQLVKVAGMAFDKGDRKNSEEQVRDIFHDLFDSGLRLCQGMHGERSWHALFSDYLSKVIQANETYLKVAHPFVQRLCEELPTSDAKHYARLLLQCRAYSMP